MAAAASDAPAPAEAPPVSVEDLDSLLPGCCFSTGVIHCFFSVLFPAILRGEGLYQHLERCLVLAPGLLCELRSLLLGPSGEATEQAFPGLESWCRSHTLLEKQFVLLPLVDAAHASLLIVCQLGGQPAASAAEGSNVAAPDRTVCSRPCILHLDSLHVKGQGHRPNLGALRALLQRALQQQGATPMELTEKTLPAVVASVPQQAEPCDGAAYMCTNALYFVASLPPGIDPQAVVRLDGYRAHLQDLFEGTPHCYPGFLTAVWYPKNVPASLRKRLLQGLAGLVQQQAGRDPADRDVLLHRARELDVQLRAVSRRPFDMPAKRKQKQEDIKASLRLQHNTAGGTLISEGNIPAKHAASAAMHDATAASPAAAAATEIRAEPAVAAKAPARACGDPTVSLTAGEAVLASGGDQPDSRGRQLRSRSGRGPLRPAGSSGAEEVVQLNSISDSGEATAEGSDTDSDYQPAQHDDEHKRAPARHRRQASLGRERPAGLAAGAASGPRAWGASSKGRPGSAGQGPHPAASAAADRAADQAAARAGAAAVATARGAKRMGTGDLRGRLTLGGKEYYLGRFPTALAAAQAEDYAALWRLGPTAAEARNKLNLPLNQYDSDLLAAVRACPDFPAVKALAQKRCGTSVRFPQGALDTEDIAVPGAGRAAEPAASSAGKPAGPRSNTHQQVGGASVVGTTKRPADGALPGSEPMAKRQQAGLADSVPGMQHAAWGSAQREYDLKQKLPADVREGLRVQPLHQLAHTALSQLRAAEHAPEGQRLRKQMQAIIKALQLLGMGPDMWTEYLEFFSQLPEYRQHMRFVALQAHLEQSLQADDNAASAADVVTRWVMQQLNS